MNDATFSAAILGSQPRWTRGEVAERGQVPITLASQLWQALGFPDTTDDDPAFTDRDIDALRAVRALYEAGGLLPAESVVLARMMGRALANLAEGQVEAMVASYGLPDTLTRSPQLLPPLQALVVYVWQRHLLASTLRLAATPDPTATPRVVGFVDLVGYTATARELSAEELVALIAAFDETVHTTVVSGHGRVVKTIGDEVMWVQEDPTEAARTALQLVESLTAPPVRIGLAYGVTVARGGDHFGPVVNVAARLTELSRPGTVLLDREMAQALAGAEDLYLRPLRPHQVRGYDHLVPTRLRRRRAVRSPDA
ncbi:MAG: adenylate/guanylate cyclase domain-containing protein [Mycobacteriales bacterium]